MASRYQIATGKVPSDENIKSTLDRLNNLKPIPTLYMEVFLESSTLIYWVTDIVAVNSTIKINGHLKNILPPFNGIFEDHFRIIKTGERTHRSHQIPIPPSFIDFFKNSLPGDFEVRRKLPRLELQSIIDIIEEPWHPDTK